MPQSKTRKVTLATYIGSKAFRDGVEDYHKGVWRADEYPLRFVLQYEKGRLFAAACGDNLPTLKVGRYVTPAALIAYRKHRNEGAWT